VEVCVVDDRKLAWVGLNNALARVNNALSSLGGIPSLGDEDGLFPDSLDSFIGLVELDLVRIRVQLENTIGKLEKEIKANDLSVLQ